MVYPNGPIIKSVQAQPAAAAQATVTVAAAGSRKHCVSLTVSLAAGATAQTPLLFNLRDGASGLGNILWSVAISAIIDGCFVFGLSDLDIVGTLGNAMTLESAAAPVAAAQATVAFSYYEDSGNQ